MQRERRKEKRKIIDQACWIVTDSDNQPQQCNLRDISGLGARLAYDESGQLPDRIILLLTEDGRAARNCRVAWRSEKEFGVRFLEKTQWRPTEFVPLDI